MDKREPEIDIDDETATQLEKQFEDIVGMPIDEVPSRKEKKQKEVVINRSDFLKVRGMNRKELRAWTRKNGVKLGVKVVINEDVKPRTFFNPNSNRHKRENAVAEILEMENGSSLTAK